MICDHRHLLSFVEQWSPKKRHKDDSSMLLFLCLQGTRIGGGEDDDNHKSSSSSIFHMNDKGQKKNTKMITLCCHLHVWEEWE